MKPFVWRGPVTRRWYVSANAFELWPFKSARRYGYATWREAYDVAYRLTRG